jgi:hypothetical protein
MKDKNMGKRNNSKDNNSFQEPDNSNYVNYDYVDDRDEVFDRKYRERNMRDYRKERRRQKETW